MDQKQFKPGQVWKNRAGELKTIAGIADSGTYPVKTLEGDVYTECGSFYSEMMDHELDLVTCVADVVASVDTVEPAEMAKVFSDAVGNGVGILSVSDHGVSHIPTSKIFERPAGVTFKPANVDPLIQSVRTFTQAVGCTTDRYNVRQAALYTGLQIEELAEKLDAIFGNGNPVAEEMHAFANDFKKGEWDHAIESADRAAMLDADVDLAWVTIGSMLSQGADVEGACGEVARANMSKLVNCTCIIQFPDGPSADIQCQHCNGLGLVAIKDEHGKVRKPDGFVPPDIGPFVCKESA